MEIKTETEPIPCCTCIAPKCERQAASMDPADYCQFFRVMERELAKAVEAGDLITVGTDPQGRTLYQRKPPTRWWMR
jgi:hypothetical protein